MTTPWKDCPSCNGTGGVGCVAFRTPIAKDCPVCVAHNEAVAAAVAAVYVHLKDIEDSLQKTQAERDALAAEAGAMKAFLILPGHAEDCDKQCPPTECPCWSEQVNVLLSAPATAAWIERHDREVRDQRVSNSTVRKLIRVSNDAINALRDETPDLSGSRLRRKRETVSAWCALVGSIPELPEDAAVERGAQEGEAT